MDVLRAKRVGAHATAASADAAGAAKKLKGESVSQNGDGVHPKVKRVGLLRKRRVCESCGHELHASWSTCRFCEDKVPTFTDQVQRTLFDEAGDSLDLRQLAWLVPLADSEQGRVIALRSPMTIGSGESADLTIADSFMSQCHSELQSGADCWTIVDLDSRNGTFLNGNRLDGEKTEELFDHDMLKIGRTMFLFKCL